MTPSFRLFARWIALCSSLVMLVSCGRPLRLQVVLEKNEEVAKGTSVFVDSREAGNVVSVGEEGGERVANLVITAKEARERLRVGAVRVRQAGRIQINSDAVKDGATALPHGARIPTTSKAGYWVAKYSRSSTLVAVGIAVVALVVLWLVFRSLVGTIGLIMCVVLAGVLTQVIHPYFVPWAEKGLNRIGPPPRALSSPPARDEVKAAPPSATSQTEVAPSVSAVYQKAESTITEVINARPSPVVVTWCGVFVVLFIGFNLVLGRVSRVWRN